MEGVVVFRIVRPMRNVPSIFDLRDDRNDQAVEGLVLFLIHDGVVNFASVSRIGPVPI